MDNYLTNIVGKGMIFPIQLTRNEKGETKDIRTVAVTI